MSAAHQQAGPHPLRPDVPVGRLAPADEFLAAPRPIALLDADPDLGAALDPERFAVARRALRIHPFVLARGAWEPEYLASIGDQGLGLLVFGGVIAREVLLADTVSTELLGPGDLFRPQDSADPRLVQQRVRYQVLAEARLGVLGGGLVNALPHFPEVNGALLERSCARAQRLATTQAIACMNSVERRVLVHLWHLAERWGRVTSGGVVVPLTLSHRLLGELVGARRPTVTVALAALEREGSVRRLDDATWLLTGEPAGTPADALERAVPHRRRLVG